MRVLCTGDIHIGRRSTRLPTNVNSRMLSCSNAWERIVECAIDQYVDLVVLSGDVVDQDNRFFESLGPLERGLRRLQDASIRVVAVTGNHDYGVLPSLARSLPPGCLTLLGVGGTWERAEVVAADQTRLYVDGWSFPTRHVTADPLASYALPEATDGPVLGLLHADLNSPNSSYAPVPLWELQAKRVDLWILGHIHAAALIEAAGKPSVLYPGSPQPMDPGEVGSHGPWIVEVASNGSIKARLLPLGTVRYESVDVDVTGAINVDQLRQVIVERVSALTESYSVDADSLRYVSLRIRLTGSSGLHRQLGAEAAALCSDLEREVDDIAIHIERVEVATRPNRDLDELARGKDAAAVLARLLQDLDSAAAAGDWAECMPSRYEALTRPIADITDKLRAAKPYRSLHTTTEEFHPRMVREVVAQQASALLDALLSQQETEA